jgi:predicted  nucleic acid-binding Zn-ribbon protein
MPHTCEACGEAFGTLSRLRLHDCPAENDQYDWEQEAVDHK